MCTSCDNQPVTNRPEEILPPIVACQAVGHASTRPDGGGSILKVSVHDAAMFALMIPRKLTASRESIEKSEVFQSICDMIQTCVDDAVMADRVSRK